MKMIEEKERHAKKNKSATTIDEAISYSHIKKDGTKANRTSDEEGFSST